jgi:uncharacterized protein involved in response to NO
MMRAGLGHTGRKVVFGLMEKSILACMFIGVITRVFLPLIDVGTFGMALHCGMGFWTLGFILYLIKYLPFFLKERCSAD